MNCCFANRVIDASQLMNIAKFDIAGFDSIEMVNSDELSVEVSGTESDLTNVQFHRDKNEFKIHFYNRQGKHENISIKLFIPKSYLLDYEFIKIGNVITAPNSVFDRLNLNVTSIGVVHIRSECGNVRIKATAIGSFEMAGQGSKSDFVLKNVSRIDCSAFVISELDVSCINVSDASFNVRNSISGQVINCSKVVVTGQPKNKNLLNRNSREIIYK